MKSLFTNKGVEFFVDDDVYIWGRNKCWHLSNGYPRCYIHGTGYGNADGYDDFLHRILMADELANNPDKRLVHHVDENPLNCQRSNLKLATDPEHYELHGRREKTLHRIQQSSGRTKCGYKGVCWHKRMKKWSAQAVVDGKNQTLGYFHAAEEAAIAYDAVVINFRGKGHTNLIPLPSEPAEMSQAA